MAKFYKKGTSQRTMKRFIHTQTRKAVTATAGVQTIIESPIGAYKVDNIDKWWFFNPANPSNYLLTDIDDKGNDFYVFEIKEPRLLNRLRGTGIFQNLQKLIQVPPNAQNEDNRLMPAKENQALAESRDSSAGVAEPQIFAVYRHCAVLDGRAGDCPGLLPRRSGSGEDRCACRLRARARLRAFPLHASFISRAAPPLAGRHSVCRGRPLAAHAGEPHGRRD